MSRADLALTGILVAGIGLCTLWACLLILEEGKPHEGMRDLTRQGKDEPGRLWEAR